MVNFPVDLFLVDSNLNPIKESINQFVAGLTKWQPSVKKVGVVMPPKVEISGKNYEDALAKMNTAYLMNSWGDGLPLLPATEERVRWILRGTDLPRDSIVGPGKILPRGGIATVEVVAAALAMAGGRPEYLPILLATVEAMLDPGLVHQGWQSTTSSIIPAAIVNGPIAKEIRLNSGWGLIGPNTKFPAGAAIGRALRLLQQNVGGAVPGVGTMAQYGGMRYTNAVFAEDEDGLPPGWNPLSTDRFGLAKGLNAVTVYPVSSAVNIHRRGTGKGDAKDEAIESLYRIADHIASPNTNTYNGFHEGTPGILIMSSTIANLLAESGWSPEKIRDFLWENTKVPLANLKKQGMPPLMPELGIDTTNMSDPFPITAQAKNFMLVVAGGQHPTHAYWMQAAQGPKVANVQIKLPAKWDELIKEAEQDLGPIPL